MVCEGLGPLGLKLDSSRNKEARGRATVISAANSQHKIMVMPTNEELSITLQSCKLTGVGKIGVANTTAMTEAQPNVQRLRQQVGRGRSTAPALVALTHCMWVGLLALCFPSSYQLTPSNLTNGE